MPPQDVANQPERSLGRSEGSCGRCHAAWPESAPKMRTLFLHTRPHGTRGTPTGSKATPRAAGAIAARRGCRLGCACDRGTPAAAGAA
eukprot:scaffold3484_cov69-Phaeocystis_antarctica.AAC.3